VLLDLVAVLVRLVSHCYRPHRGLRSLPARRSSDLERMVDALALRADEGRDKLRKASGRGKYPSIRRYPNGETWLSKPQSSLSQSDRKSTRLNSSHVSISYAVFCLK